MAIARKRNIYPPHFFNISPSGAPSAFISTGYKLSAPRLFASPQRFYVELKRCMGTYVMIISARSPPPHTSPSTKGTLCRPNNSKIIRSRNLDPRIEGTRQCPPLIAQHQIMSCIAVVTGIVRCIEYGRELWIRSCRATLAVPRLVIVC